jgi:hypothetical protein
VPEIRNQFFLENQLESSRQQEQQNLKRLLAEGLLNAVALYTPKLGVNLNGPGSKYHRPLPVITRVRSVLSNSADYPVNCAGSSRARWSGTGRNLSHSPHPG